MSRPSPGTLSDDTRVLVSEYVCGLLKPDERPRVHALLSRDDHALALALAWEMELLALVDALPRVQPSDALQERLQRSLGIGPPPAFQPPPQPQLLQKPSREYRKVAPPPASPQQVAPPVTPPRQPRPQTAVTSPSQDPLTPPSPAGSPMPPPPPSATAAPANPPSVNSEATAPPITAASPAATSASTPPTLQAEPPQSGADRRYLLRKLWLWRLIAVSATVAAIVGFMLPGEPPPPPVQVVKVAPTRAAILHAPGTSSTPGWTATVGPEGNLMMRPLVRTEVPTGSQTLLWTRSAQIPEPRLLGRIDPNLPVQVPAAQLGALAEDQLLEITLEKDEDAAKAVPNGPILFIGQMTMFGSEGAAASRGLEAEGSPAAGAITN